MRVVVLVLASGCGEGVLHLAVRDALTGAPVAARVEILDDDDDEVIGEDGLEVIAQCAFPPLGGSVGFVQDAFTRSRAIYNPYRRRQQVYVHGDARLSLPAGRYRVRVEKGLNHHIATATADLVAGGEARVEIPLRRWIEPRREGWFAADDHLHIPRFSPGDDDALGAWMSAEDLDVANLLQMGSPVQFGVTPQYAFGDAGSARAHGVLLLAGQEHPRTHVFGHAIVLGSRSPIDLREAYLVYARAFEAARAHGGVAGFAHWGVPPARLGLAVTAPTGLVSFVEVLQFDWPHYDAWYDLLNLGLRVAPTAGSDFPCGPDNLPGRERFYARVLGELTRASFVEAVRAGRTQVTNGPYLQLRVDGRDIGDELTLAAPGEVEVTGVAFYDPQRDDLDRIELVFGGEVVEAATAAHTPGELRLARRVRVERSGWLALRASGRKVDEAPPVLPGLWSRIGLAIEAGFAAGGGGQAGRNANLQTLGARPAAAHSGAIYVTVAGSPPIAWQPAGRALARERIAWLDSLAEALRGEDLERLTLWRTPYGDGVTLEDLRRDRDELLASIAEARAAYTAQAETSR